MAGYNKNELAAMGGGFLENTHTLWQYVNSAGDSESTIKGNAYFSDGVSKGMKVGDIVVCYNLGGTATSVALLLVSDITVHPCTVAADLLIT